MYAFRVLRQKNLHHWIQTSEERILRENFVQRPTRYIPEVIALVGSLWVMVEKVDQCLNILWAELLVKKHMSDVLNGHTRKNEHE